MLCIADKIEAGLGDSILAQEALLEFAKVIIVESGHLGTQLNPLKPLFDVVMGELSARRISHLLDPVPP